VEELFPLATLQTYPCNNNIFETRTELPLEAFTKHAHLRVTKTLTLTLTWTEDMTKTAAASKGQVRI